MEKLNINRHNYQEFFMLYTDKELDATEKKAVENFVLLNPDLEAELRMLQQAVLKPDNEIVFKNKESLLQFSSEGNYVHPGNFEELSVRYAENELSNIEKAQLEDFICAQPQYQQEFDLIQSLKLTADESIVFPNKELLYRYEKDKKLVLFSWGRMVAAAIILLLASLLWLNNHNTASPTKDTVQIMKAHPQGKANTALFNKAGKKENALTVADGDTRAETRGLQQENVVLSGNNKKSIDQKEMQKNKSTFKEITSKKVDVTERKATTSKNIEAEQVEKEAEPIAAQIGNDVRTQPEKRGMVLGNIDPNKEGIMNNFAAQSVIKSKKGNLGDESVTRNAASADEDENIFLANLPGEKKNSLRGIFRKASRLINKTTSFRGSKKSGLLIGNIEIAFQ